MKSEIYYEKEISIYYWMTMSHCDYVTFLKTQMMTLNYSLTCARYC